jgi:predicted phage terminase large subunit-like protein
MSEVAQKPTLSDADLLKLEQNLDKMTEAELRTWLTTLDATVEVEQKESCQEHFMDFVHRVWPDFIDGAHHSEMAAAFERVANGQCRRLIINMPPRHTKSEFASYLLPAWFLGKFPKKKVIQTSHTAELAVGFGRKVRNLVDSDLYKAIFPGVGLQVDSKAAGRWATNQGGDYFAIGVGGAVTGKGADILIIDDPHSEQEAALSENNPEVYDKTYEWYTSGPRQRLQPGGAIIMVMTRWSKKDLTGQVVKSAQQRSGEEWEVIEFPAILPDGLPLWPQFWKLQELLALKQELPNGKWMAQYMQQPTSDVSAIIKREWWKNWEHEDPPICEFIIQSWDTAFLKTERSDYSACTTWGVFYQENERGLMVANIILLNSFKQRMEFPELKQKAYEQYKNWDPDSLIVEAKASGAPLVFELRAMGIPVQEFTPSKGSDKIARLNSVADIFASGRVWVPNTHWADELVEEVASFPSGEHDDLVDSTSQAMLRFRRGGFIQLDTDEEDEPRYFKSGRNQGYYNV